MVEHSQQFGLIKRTSVCDNLHQLQKLPSGQHTSLSTQLEKKEEFVIFLRHPFKENRLKLRYTLLYHAKLKVFDLIFNGLNLINNYTKTEEYT